MEVRRNKWKESNSNNSIVASTIRSYEMMVSTNCQRYYGMYLWAENKRANQLFRITLKRLKQKWIPKSETHRLTPEAVCSQDLTFPKNGFRKFTCEALLSLNSIQKNAKVSFITKIPTNKLLKLQTMDRPLYVALELCTIPLKKGLSFGVRVRG